MNRKFSSIFALFLILTVQGWFLYTTFTHPINSVLVEKDERNNWRIAQINGDGVLASSGIRTGDVVLSVNGISASEYPSILRWRSIDQSHSISVQRDGSILYFHVPDGPTPGMVDLVSFTAEIISIFIALLLSKKIRQSVSSLPLAYVFLVIGLAFMSLPASIRGDLLGKVLISTALLLLPVVFYHFISKFLWEKGQIRLPVCFLKRAYQWSALFFVVHLVFLTPFSTAYTLYRYMTTVTMTFTVTGMMANILILLVTSFRYRKRNDFLSLILKTVTLSLILSLAPIMFLSFIPQLLFGREWIDSVYTSLTIFILPLTFAYLIVAKKLYDIDMVMRRILFTGLIALVPSILFTIMIKLLASSEITDERLSIAFLIFLVSNTFILYSLENLATKLEPVMFPRKYRLKIALKKISRNLGTISSLREMKDIILLDIIQTLDVQGGAILYKYPGHSEAICEGNMEPSELEHLVADGSGSESGCMLYEITRHEEFTGYLILSERNNRSVLNSEELHWLQLIITYLAVSLENIHLIRKLRVKLEQFASHIPNEHEAGDIAWFRKLMFELQEKERSRIATDLHDTTMQDLFFLKERLRNLLARYTFRKVDQEAMEGLMDYIDIINTNLRQSCFELHPYLLQEIGLVQTVRKLIDLEAISSPFEIDLNVTGASLLEQQDPDTKRHLFRLVQELINNAKKHSKADLIRISFHTSLAGILLRYEDNGVGYDPHVLGTGEIGGPGIGLEQMKSRIISMGGDYRIDSAPGQGMKMEATIPIRKEQSA